ncbi:hypothetical protein ZOSMA_151G00050 [Zostera marina]|uniref:TTF-type domain-containing protein n=1 Tax=Zostera marina TaxID=29655 RepID=A0A0K9PW73_ZOSMR|nr:hypothetical protein ZOSMA_151G00050 [Zostera marina]
MYNINEIDDIRRKYIQKGPCQPKQHLFPQTWFGKFSRRFNCSWFDTYSTWLEYSISDDSAFCLCCYLFKPYEGDKAGGDTFVTVGFRNWKKPDKLLEHVGLVDSSHNKAWEKYQNMRKAKHQLEPILEKQTISEDINYRMRLTASLDAIRYLLNQGLPFRGHNESNESLNKGNFLELLEVFASRDENYKQAMITAPRNNLMRAPLIQSQLMAIASAETTRLILKDLNHDLFAVLIDESRDISIKEQMDVVIRYVDKKECVMERYLAVVHVPETNALTLKKALDALFCKHNLSITNLRGQGYDGASNMSGDINGLKSLILKENNSAFYVHCFAHQLQLTIVAAAKSDKKIVTFFNTVANITNIVVASCKRRDVLREKQADSIAKALDMEELNTGQGKNQETTLKRAGDTRWVLEVVSDDAKLIEQSASAEILLDAMKQFDFIFYLNLLEAILAITDDLSQALQRKDQDINNAMRLVTVSKQRLQDLRDNGWEDLLSNICSLCAKNDITVPSMDEIYVPYGRKRRNIEKITSLHYYKIDRFFYMIDIQIQELNNRFTETNTELLLCIHCLDPHSSFEAFNIQKLLRFASFYPADFSPLKLMMLNNQLQNYIHDVQSNEDFDDVVGIGGLAQKLVECKMDIVYPLVYLLIKLALILPVATASVERSFSAMHIVKTRLRNRLGDSLMNDCLVTYIEKDIFKTIDNEVILKIFNDMCPRRRTLK